MPSLSMEPQRETISLQSHTCRGDQSARPVPVGSKASQGNDESRCGKPGKARQGKATCKGPEVVRRKGGS